MKSQSQLIEETRLAYVDHLEAKEHDVSPGDYLAVVFLAATIVNDMYDHPTGINRMPGRINTMINWATEYKPKAIDTINTIFSDPMRAKDIARIIFAGVTPAGGYNSMELLEGLQSGNVYIDWHRSKS